MACPNPFDVLRMKSEDLGPTLYVRASWKDPWLNLIQRDTWPVGAGVQRSVFTIGRSEPTSDEEAWSALTVNNGSNQGGCAITYNTTQVGHEEVTYKPEIFGLKGPLICQDDLTLHWRSNDFWEKYFQALEKRNTRSIVNRLANIYMNYVPKASANANFHWHDGDLSTQPAATAVDLSDLDEPQCTLTQEFLDATALELIEEGADDPNSNGWITQGASGPEFPLLIGVEASNQLLLNNSELRSDYNQAFQGWKEANPVIQRLGASRIIKNFRHMITRFPARWDYVQGNFVRRPVWTMPASSGGQGYLAVINEDWKNAAYEAAVVLSPWVFTEEVLQPVNSTPGIKWNAQNYYGEWQFVTGNDAVLGMDSCGGIQDPLHKQGRHFAEYRHAAKPIFPTFGRLILFKRCVNSYTCVTCT